MRHEARATTAGAGRADARVVWCEADALLTDVQRFLVPGDVVLDIGCGINPQNYIKPAVQICCEPFQQYVERLQGIVAAQTDRIYVIIRSTWEEAVRLFPPASVDTVFLVDVIEHLDKETGRRLLAQTELIARRQVVLFTPLGFMPQHHEDGKDAWGMDGASWQEHKSGWMPDEFDDTWRILCCRAFHFADNLGRQLEKPYGAFWAVKTHRGEIGGHRAGARVKPTGPEVGRTGWRRIVGALVRFLGGKL